MPANIVSASCARYHDMLNGHHLALSQQLSSYGFYCSPGASHHAYYHGALIQILGTEQCWVVLWTPHQRPGLYYITCTDHSCHAFTDAEKSNVVHLVTVCWAFLLQCSGLNTCSTRRQQVMLPSMAHQHTKLLSSPVNAMRCHQDRRPATLAVRRATPHMIKDSAFSKCSLATSFLSLQPRTTDIS